MDFYDQIADSYDEMTRFEQRFQNEKQIVQAWFDKLHFQSAIDVACGTGLHAILLASLGVNTTGVDISAKMLKNARKNATRIDKNISWIKSSMEDLQNQLKGPYDVLFCLGNSLPHILSQEGIEQTFRNFYNLLTPTGCIMLQLLNYDNILKNRQRIIGINKIKNSSFVRFYDFIADQVQFNILKIIEHDGLIDYDLQSTRLYPYRKEELESLLVKSKFVDLQFYGDTKFTPYDLNSSNLVTVAHKKK